MDTISDRIKKIIREQNINQNKLAEISNVSSQAVTNWIKRNQISIEAARKICSAYNYSLDWLLNGESKPKSNATIIGTVDGWDSNTPLGDDDVEVPFYKDVRLSAGNGFADDIEDYNGYKLRLSKSTLKRYGIDKSCVVCLTADGYSMEPVLPDGTTVGINTAEKNIKDGKIYAINHDGLLRVKILENVPGNQVRIKSYNPGYDPEEVSLDNINILGRVFWWSVID